ncbi:hypothetical protein FCM35_KLT02906 [Carex littledalei]|uniref:Uncharacterized protein n=1 Tax=Carex littledalei TaxID=544730 RepID=A0A833VLK3_9POAL|nr:hypothetical protein FCM35_KLT02906 [Carex littledalei]
MCGLSLDLHMHISEEPTDAIQPARVPLLRLLRRLLLRVLLLVPDVPRAPKSGPQHVFRISSKHAEPWSGQYAATTGTRMHDPLKNHNETFIEMKKQERFQVMKL